MLENYTQSTNVILIRDVSTLSDSSDHISFPDQRPISLNKIPEGVKFIFISANRDKGPVEIGCSSRPPRRVK